MRKRAKLSIAVAKRGDYADRALDPLIGAVNASLREVEAARRAIAREEVKPAHLRAIFEINPEACVRFLAFVEFFIANTPTDGRPPFTDAQICSMAADSVCRDFNRRSEVEKLLKKEFRQRELDAPRRRERCAQILRLLDA